LADQCSISILGRNEIDCQGLSHILSEGGLAIDHCLPDSPALALAGWTDEPTHIIIVDNALASAALERCAMLRLAMRRVRIVLMSDDCDLATIRDAFANGVDGILARHISAKPLISAIKLVALGEKVIPSQFVKMLIADGGLPSQNEWAAHSSLAHLSSREVEILGCLVAGDANKTIALKLSVAEATVKAHIKAILRKLQLDNRTQAAIWAISRGTVGMAQDHRPQPTASLAGQGAKISDHNNISEERSWRS